MKFTHLVSAIVSISGHPAKATIPPIGFPKTRSVVRTYSDEIQDDGIDMIATAVVTFVSAVVIEVFTDNIVESWIPPVV